VFVAQAKLRDGVVSGQVPERTPFSEFGAVVQSNAVRS
jgi:hypothetical protein